MLLLGTQIFDFFLFLFSLPSCNGRAVITEGDAFKDTICEEQTKPAFQTQTVGPMVIITPTASITVTTVGANADSTTPNEEDSTQSFRSSVSVKVSTLSTTSPTTTSQQDTVLGMICTIKQ